MKNEKYYLKKYRLLSWALLIVMLALIPVVYLTVKSYAVALFCCMVICAVGFFVKRIIVRKVLLSVLLDDLDAPLFRKIVKKGKLVGLQMLSEYYCGNFGNVVEFCRKKLADPKAAKKGRYAYLGRLAVVYFVTGDDENLREICEETGRLWEREKPSVKRKQAPHHSVFDFYNAYLAGDWEICEGMNQAAGKTKLEQIAQLSSRARIALAKGEVELAKELFEEARKAPNLCYAAFAEEGLRAIEEGRPYGEGFEPLSVTDDFYVMYPTKAAEFFRRVSIVCFVIAIILLWVSAGLELHARMEEEKAKEAQSQQGKEPDLQKLNQLKQDKEEYKKQAEKLRVLVEKDYDNVEVLKIVNLLNDSNEILDTLFLFKDGDNLFIATVYIHIGDEDTYYYQVQVTLPLFALEEEYMVRDFSFACVTSMSSVSVRFCLNTVSIPVTAKGCLTFDVDQKTVYLVLLSIVEE